MEPSGRVLLDPSPFSPPWPDPCEQVFLGCGQNALSLSLKLVAADSWDRIDEMGEDWLDLADRTSASLFADPGFVRLWIKHRDPDSEPLVISLRDREGRLRALAPLRLTGTAKFRTMGIDRLCFMVSESCFSFDILSDVQGQGWADRLLGSAMARAEPDMIDLYAIPASSPTISSLERCGRGSGYSLSLIHPMTWKNCMVDLSGGWEAFLARRSAKTRKMLRRTLRGVESEANMEVTVSRGGDKVVDDLGQVERIVSRSWKDPSPFLKGGFWRDVMEYGAGRGWLELHLLYLGGRPVSFVVLLRHRETVYLVQLGYDQDYSQLSPGAYLMYRVMRSCFRDPGPQGRMDFLTSFDYLQRVSDRMGARVAARGFRRDLKGRGLSFGFSMLNWARELRGHHDRLLFQGADDLAVWANRFAAA